MFADVNDLQVEHGFSLWADGHLTINVVESAQQCSSSSVSRRIGCLPLINGDMG